MKLTGKCKEDFHKYLIDLKKTDYNQYYYHFDDLTDDMKYGVYVSFAEKYGQANNLVNHILKLQRIYYVDMNCGLEESRLESVSKFNLIYNSQNET
jgi:hypothetical protein